MRIKKDIDGLKKALENKNIKTHIEAIKALSELK